LEDELLLSISETAMVEKDKPVETDVTEPGETSVEAKDTTIEKGEPDIAARATDPSILGTGHRKENESY